jgi:hypothetical protein
MVKEVEWPLKRYNQRNQRKQNEIDWYEENGKKKKKRQNEIKK